MTRSLVETSAFLRVERGADLLREVQGFIRDPNNSSYCSLPITPSKSTRHVTILQDVLCFTVVHGKRIGFPITPGRPEDPPEWHPAKAWEETFASSDVAYVAQAVGTEQVSGSDPRVPP